MDPLPCPVEMAGATSSNKVDEQMNARKVLGKFAGLLLLSLMWCGLSAAQQGSGVPAEAELLAVLRSDAPRSEKALTFKKLAVYGSSQSVSEVVKWLPDPELSSWARIALEAIPGEEVDVALREAAEKLDGLVLVGVLNSIGVRRDPAAVGLLTDKCGASDPEVQAAAIAALGQIGTLEAANVLRPGLATQLEPLARAKFAEAAIVCAERLWQGGQTEAALNLYEQVRKAEVPLQRQLEATRGVILASGDRGLALLAECLQGDDAELFRLGLTVTRELSAERVSPVLVEALGKAPEKHSGLLVTAMADRPGAETVAAILAVAKSGNRSARLAALAALGRVGNADCLGQLLSLAVERDEELATAARLALAQVPGAQVDQQIAGLLQTAAGEQLKLLVELVGLRRIGATNFLFRIIDSRDSAMRRAALVALGETVELPDLGVLVERASGREFSAEETAAARQALRTAAVRMPDREACAETLAQALNRASEDAQVFFIETLGEVGGDNALRAIVAAAKGNQTALQDAGSKLLGKWSNLADAATLLDYARTGPTNQYRVRALKGYIALARRFAMPETERVEMCRQALELTRQPADRKLVLDVLKLHPSAEAFLLATELAEAGELQSEATEVLTTIAQKLGGQGIDLEKLKALFGGEQVKLEILEAKYGAGDTWQDVTAVVRKHSGNLPWVSLPSPNYNQCFGGDPAPGVPKQLRMKYRLNGREGEASFSENAMILLPIPKQ